MEKHKLRQLHRRDIQNIAAELACRKSTWQTRELSHMMRKKSYKKKAPVLSDHKLNRILSLDKENGRLWVEPYVTQEALVKATLPYGWVPPVVAEFKKITVGGAIMGGSLESSSHAWGQFNDVALSYELLLGDGSIIEASKEAYSDLYWGLSGSYGALARLLAIELPLLPAKRFVEVQAHTFSTIDSFVEALRKLCKEKNRPDYIEGLVFNKDRCKIITGTLCDESDRPLYSQAASSSPWFHQMISEEKTPFKMLLSEYLFRYDRGAFWMGTYALWPSLLYRFLLNERLPFPKNPRGFYNTPKYPNLFFRTLFGSMMNSSTLYKWLHWKRENWFERHFVVQDFYLPESQTADFIHFSLESNEIKPLWICPCRATKTPQLFASQLQPEETLVFDVGIYGWPKEPFTGPDATGLLESMAYRLKGKKMFYSWNYLTLEEIWRHYPQKDYEALKTKYDPNKVFPDFIEKVLPL